MKQNKKNLLTKLQSWVMLILAMLVIGQTSKAEVVYDDSVNRTTNGAGDALVFTQSGYEYGDEVILGGTARYLTNISFEYYQMGIPAGATIRLRIYENDGAAYGTNFNAPGSMLFDSQAFNVGGNGDGFHTVTLDRANSGLGIPVSGSFTWTVEFGGVTSGTAALSLYDAPVVGTSYDDYWELSGAGNSWVYRSGTGGLVANFGSQAGAVTVNDVNPPTSLSFSSPGDKFVTSSLSLAINGAVKDGSTGRVAVVLLKSGLGVYRPATLTTGSGGATNWSINLDLAAGTNSCIVKAIDWAGNFTTNKRTFTYAVFQPFTVTLKDDGVTSSTGGTIKPPWTTTTGTTNLMIGRVYTVEAVVSPNFHFLSNAIISLSGTNITTYPSTVKKYTFTMATNLALTVNFVTNRFRAVAGFYVGLFGESDTNQNTSGLLNFKLATSAGAAGKTAYSGKVVTAGEEVSFAGVFGLGSGSVAESTSSVTKYSKYLSNQYVVTLSLPFDGSDQVTGSVSNVVTGVSSPLSADRNTWANSGGVTNLATNYAGVYVVAIPAGAGGPPGWASLNFKIKATDGKIDTGTGGYLGDATPVKQFANTFVSKLGKWPMFMQALGDTNVFSGKVKTASMIGWLQFADSSAGISGTAKIIRTPNTGAAYYQTGYTNVQAIIGEGFIPHTSPFSNRVVELGVAGEGFLDLSGGGLVTPLSILITSKTNTTFQTHPLTGVNGPYKSSLKVNAAKGVAQLKFNNPDTLVDGVSGVGVALPNANRVYGWFKGPSDAGNFEVSP